MTIIDSSYGKYSRTPAGFEAWKADGNKGTYDDFIRADRKRASIMMQIDQLLGKLSDAELKNVFDFLTSKYFR